MDKGNSSLTQSLRELEKSALDRRLALSCTDFSAQPTNLTQDTRIANDLKDSSLRGESIDSRPTSSLRGSGEATTKQSKTHESNKNSESMIEKRINESDSPLQQSDSNNLDSRVLDSSLVALAQNDEHTQPKLRPLIKGANGLSLGISIVVAILLGIGAGLLMQKIFGVFWVLFLGVAWGIAAAILNVYKVYKAELRDFEKIADDPKYKNA